MGPLSSSGRLKAAASLAARVDLDLVPTQPLRGLHYRGTVEQRIIANYPVPPAALQPLVPAGARLWVRDGTAWLSACFVEMSGVRPAGLPAWAGLSFRYLVNRTMVDAPFPDGLRRKAVLVLQAFGDPAVPRVLGRVLGGAPFRPARLRWSQGTDGFEVKAEAGGDVVYQARSRKGFASARFSGLAAADDALLGMAWGSHHDGAWRFFPETHDPWQAEGLDVATARYAFRDRLGVAAEADHAIAMAHCPHYFGRPIRG